MPESANFVPVPIEQDPRGAYTSVKVRLSDRDLDALTALALLDDTSPASEIRGATKAYIESRLADPALTQLVERRLDGLADES